MARASTGAPATPSACTPRITINISIDAASAQPMQAAT